MIRPCFTDAVSLSGCFFPENRYFRVGAYELSTLIITQISIIEQVSPEIIPEVQ